MFIIIAIILIFLADLFIKAWARKALVDKDIDKAKGHIRFNLLYNSGAAMGIFSSHKKVLNVITILVVAFLLLVAPEYLKKNTSLLEKLGYTFATAGALNNSYERLFKGRVTDYISFPKFPGKIKNIVFNISDFLIMIGAVLLAVGSFFKK
ncbi:MAG: signal peptidase II [Lachnospiraceae bacterium]|nr:signal peptidase II [Lachnospiraceae bacterium]